MRNIIFTLLCISCASFNVYAQTQKTYPLAAGKVRFRASSVVINNQGKLFIGYNAVNTPSAFVGLQVLDTVTGVNQIYDSTSVPMAVGAVNTLEVQGDILWIGTWNGLLKWNTVTNIWSKFDRTNSVLKSDSISSIRISNDSTLLIGTTKGFYTYKSGSWTEYNTQNTILTSNWITAVACESNGKIWLGCPNGLFSVDHSNWTMYNRSNSDLAFDSIQNIYVGKNNKVWIQTRVYNPQKDSLKYETYSQIWYLHQPAVFKNYFRERGELLRQNSSTGDHVFVSLQFTLDHNGELTGYNYYNYNYAPQNIYIYKLTDAYPVIEALPSSAFQNLNDRNAVLFDASGKMWLPGRTKVTCINPQLYSSAIGFKQSSANMVYLDINQVKARYVPAADFYFPYQNGKGYEVPKGSGNHAMFTSGIWMGGISNNQLHVAAQTYRQNGNDFWPGPLDTVTATCDSLTSKQWDKIWKVNKSDIDSFKSAFASGRVTGGTYTIPQDILNWPAHGVGKQARYLAPFVDVNQDGQYNPMNGDYPLIKGDQMLFWIVNDNTYVHSETNGNPLGVELHISMYAYYCSQPTMNGEFLNYTTFSHIKAWNRSNRTYNDFYFSVWNDADVGDYNDDYLGSNPKQHYTYFYNQDNWDLWYNDNPPMISHVFLNKPLTHAMSYLNDFSPGQGNPTAPQHYYNYMRAMWKDSTQLTYGGNGKTSNIPANWIFPGNDDPSGLWNWTMMDTSLNLKSFDARMVATNGPMLFQAGASTELEYALVFTAMPGPRTLQDLLNQNETNCKNVRLWYTQNRLSACGVSLSDNELLNTKTNFMIYPNPSNGYLKLQGNRVHGGAQVIIQSIAGQQIFLSKLNEHGSVELNLSELPAGIYWIKVLNGEKCEVYKWIKY